MGTIDDEKCCPKSNPLCQAPTEKLKAFITAVMECRPDMDADSLQMQIEKYTRLESELSVEELLWLIDNFDRLEQAKRYHANMIRVKMCESLHRHFN